MIGIMAEPIDAGTPSRASDPFASQSSAPSAALLDFFFPGLSMFTSALQRYLHIDLNYYFPIVMFLGGITFAWNYFSNYLYSKVENHLMSTVEVRYDDEVYNMIMSWVACQPFAHNARRFIVNTIIGSRSYSVWEFNRHYNYDSDSSSSAEDDEDDQLDVSEIAAQEKEMTPEALMRKHRRQKKALSYTPTFGTYYFWHRRNFIVFRRSQSRENNQTVSSDQRESITLSCLGRDPTVLKELLLEARHMYIERDCHKTVIYRGSSSGRRYRLGEPTWVRCMARNPRPLSTVILNEKVKNDLVSDIKDYLDPATRRWYANRGIPYRRGYLLYGPPGTGKSSLSMSLAGHFKVNIYIVSLNGVAATEETLAQLFNDLPRKCIVLLEDIDTAGLTHTREGEEDGRSSKTKAKDENGENSESESSSSSDSDSDSDATTSRKKDKNSSKDDESSEKKSSSRSKKDKAGKLSLSGLLNILDGVASQEGRLLIMTTNHIEKLDKALIRPGRVDMMVKFDRADRDMMESLFRSIFATLEGDSYHVPSTKRRSSSLTSAEKDIKRAEQEEKELQLYQQAREFASSVPELMFSPAELQGYLLKYKRDPIGAVEGVKDWVAETNAAKAKSERRKELRAERSKARAKRRKEKEARKKLEKKEEKKKAKEEKEREEKEEAKEKEKEKKKKSKKTKVSETDPESSDSETDEEKLAEKKAEKKRILREKRNKKRAAETDAAPAESPISPPASSAPPATTPSSPSVSSGDQSGDLSEPASETSSKATTVDHHNVSEAEAEADLKIVAAKTGTQQVDAHT